ncbi:hypothetical protein B0T17DRAFT_518425 [Bombardia bombarda]|uniref:Uncharacterized protein n=1 Tax=Bombardia bombarda TaxID=252184 RepID=A0AA39XLF8_9PEZI|nr:hypothetical protein B0T17DRAFT_518425 [Bombardia bombarda]
MRSERGRRVLVLIGGGLMGWLISAHERQYYHAGLAWAGDRGLGMSRRYIPLYMLSRGVEAKASGIMWECLGIVVDTLLPPRGRGKAGGEEDREAGWSM